MSLISGLLAALLALLGLGPVPTPPIPPVPPGLLNIIGTTTLAPHSDTVTNLESFGGSMSGTSGGPGGLVFDVTGQLDLSFTRGVIKLNGGVIFTAPNLKPLAYEQMELSLSDLTVYGFVGGQRVAMWSIELLPIPLAARQPINTPDMLMRWVEEGLKIFNAWTPDIARDDQNNNDGSSQAQSDHEVYG